MPGRTYENPDFSGTNDYRYAFNGKELDKSGEFGSLAHYDYGFRIYNPAIGKFLSVDPLTKSYPMLTPYQFASNTPIQAIDLDGLEAAYKWGESQSNLNTPILKGGNYATTEVALISRFDYLKELPIRHLEDGYGVPQTHTYSIVLKASYNQFKKLKDTYTTNPGIIHNVNNKTKYYPVENPYDTDDIIDKGDAMYIDILGPYNGAVRFTDVNVSQASFYLGASTLEGGSFLPYIGSVENTSLNLNHPDAGKISFIGNYNSEKGEIDFMITNTTSLGSFPVALSNIIGIPRNLQKNQWLQVLENVQNFITQNKDDVIEKTYQYEGELPENIKP